MQQLEAKVTEELLPADALAANRRAFAAVQEFARSLESPQGFPKAAVKNVEFTFRWALASN
jgi:predicted carbohydrate-binding protein with CBM5 and CBM33 domain